MAKKAKKSGDQKGGALVGALATTAAVWLVRKVITAAWTRTTGKVPPTDPSDPKVSVIETLGWAVIAGASIEATRLLAARATARRARASDDPAEL
jgi:hypothetical protein